jgi:hypothetical protein
MNWSPDGALRMGGIPMPGVNFTSTVFWLRRLHRCTALFGFDFFLMHKSDFMGFGPAV